MEKPLLAWVLFGAALSAHLLFWRIAPASLALRRAGVEGELPAQAFWLVAVTQVALFAWPVVAADKLYGYDPPSVFTFVLMTGATICASVALAATVSWIWALHARTANDAAGALRAFAAGVTIAAPALAVGAFLCAWS